MVDENTVGTKAKRKPQGPRKPQPIYVFYRTDESGAVEFVKSFRNPRQMAEYVPTSQTNGEKLSVLTPE